jgi:hypothetical protein
MNALVRLEAQGNALRARAAKRWGLPMWAHYAADPGVSTKPTTPSSPPVKPKTASGRAIFPVLGDGSKTAGDRSLFPALSPGLVPDDIDAELLAAAFGHVLKET